MGWVPIILVPMTPLAVASINKIIGAGGKDLALENVSLIETS